jgi:predicted small secreted protein
MERAESLFPPSPIGYRGSQQRNWSDEMMRPAFCLMISGLLLALSACNTVQGVGRDIESVGTAGKDAIR